MPAFSVTMRHFTASTAHPVPSTSRRRSDGKNNVGRMNEPDDSGRSFNQRQGEGNDEMVHPLDELNEEGESS